MTNFFIVKKSTIFFPPYQKWFVVNHVVLEQAHPLLPSTNKRSVIISKLRPIKAIDGFNMTSCRIWLIHLKMSRFEVLLKAEYLGEIFLVNKLKSTWCHIEPINSLNATTELSRELFEKKCFWIPLGKWDEMWL